MLTGEPSRTALAAAAHRAAHQILEGGRIFADPLALRILGAGADAVVERARQEPEQRLMRLFIALRTRFAEDALAAAVAAGVRQLVVLGAGLDTFAYRSPFGESLRIFEVDHPATQQWKRHRLAAAAIDVPSALAFAPVDFECETLADGLAAAGFDAGQQAFFTWLGVVPYLREQSIFAALSLIGSVPGAHVVFDYAKPPDTLSPEARQFHDEHAARAAAIGEAWQSYFDPQALQEKMRTLGFSEFENLAPSDIARRYFPDRPVNNSSGAGRVLHAWRL